MIGMLAGEVYLCFSFSSNDLYSSEGDRFANTNYEGSAACVSGALDSLGMDPWFNIYFYIHPCGSGTHRRKAASVHHPREYLDLQLIDIFRSAIIVIDVVSK
ncbi:unnamed protein product [Amoebophrya sp. A25]|nr:unnamed protein product [Amoebophrya sp. A25]|eukprot:GSA25T00026139001.1